VTRKMDHVAFDVTTGRFVLFDSFNTSQIFSTVTKTLESTVYTLVGSSLNELTTMDLFFDAKGTLWVASLHDDDWSKCTFSTLSFFPANSSMVMTKRFMLTMSSSKFFEDDTGVYDADRNLFFMQAGKNDEISVVVDLAAGKANYSSLLDVSGIISATGIGILGTSGMSIPRSLYAIDPIKGQSKYVAGNIPGYGYPPNFAFYNPSTKTYSMQWWKQTGPLQEIYGWWSYDFSTKKSATSHAQYDLYIVGLYLCPAASN